MITCQDSDCDCDCDCDCDSDCDCATVVRKNFFTFFFLLTDIKRFTKTQRLLSNEKSSEAHKLITNSKYASLMQALSYHKFQTGLQRKNDEDFPLQSN